MRHSGSANRAFRSVLVRFWPKHMPHSQSEQICSVLDPSIDDDITGPCPWCSFFRTWVLSAYCFWLSWLPHHHYTATRDFALPGSHMHSYCPSVGRAPPSRAITVLSAQDVPPRFLCYARGTAACQLWAKPKVACTICSSISLPASDMRAKLRLGHQVKSAVTAKAASDLLAA